MSATLSAYQSSVMGTYGLPKRVLVRGSGCHVWDEDGARYLDLLGGIAVNALGHAHPRVVEAVTTQLATLGHISNFFTSPVQVALAERLLALVGVGGPASSGARATGAVFFSNSGAEANEAAFKIARRTGRPRVLAATGGFHGRTMGALALTGKEAIAHPFAPLPGGVEHLPFGDVAALEAAMGSDVAAVVLEPIQGEAGVRPAPAGYLRAARTLTREHGALLVLDEVQTGVARTGTWFAFQHPDALGMDTTAPADVPDVVTLAKGLGGGIPIGATVALGDAAALLGPGQHGSTFGGNPVSCAAALTVLDVVAEDDLLTAATQRGRTLAEGLATVDGVTGVRGRGLLLGVALADEDAADVTRVALDAGFIVNDVAPDTIRLAPPLVLSAAHVDEVVQAWPAIMRAAAQMREVPRDQALPS
jgi:acetylornithine/N-succinyldiaminopimelate aminotransferase